MLRESIFLGYYSSSDAPKNPQIAAQGLEITQGKYFRVEGTWAQTNTQYSYIFMWLYPTSGILGTFADFIISVSLQTSNFQIISDVT